MPLAMMLLLAKVRGHAQMVQDTRYAWRMLLKSPGFTAVAAITLALGIGANTAIVSVVDAALFHALPYRAPAGLVHLWETRPQREFTQMEASYPNLAEWRASNHVFSDLAGYTQMDFSLTGRGTSQRLFGARVSANFFDVLGSVAGPWARLPSRRRQSRRYPNRASYLRVVARPVRR
jgi:hypothetical protein